MGMNLLLSDVVPEDLANQATGVFHRDVLTAFHHPKDIGLDVVVLMDGNMLLEFAKREKFGKRYFCQTRHTAAVTNSCNTSR